MKKLVITSLILLFAFIVAAPVVSFASGTYTYGSRGDDDDHYSSDDDDHRSDDGHGDDDDCDNNNEIPLDGGLSILAVAGAAYGVKRIRDARKK